MRPIALQGELEQVRYRKRDDGLRYKHDVEGKSDLWLVDANGTRGTLTVPRDGRPGWERDGNTYWLTNRPEKRAMSKRASTKRRRPTTRRKAKRPPPKGYKSWSTYMASIRPNKGGTVATRKRRGRRHTKARRNPGTALILRPNRPPKRRGGYRRNPPFSVGGILGRVTDAGKGAAFMVGGEAATRYVRKNLLGMADGQTISTLTDAGIGIGLGMGVEKALGRQAGRDATAGVFAYILRSVAKQLGITALSGVLGDAGGGARYVVKNGKLVPALAGYAGRGTGRLAGYAGRGNGSATGDRDLDAVYS